MNTSELYVAAAESTNSNDTFWIAAVISIIASGYTIAAKILFIAATFALPFLGPLIWFVFVRGKEDKYGRP